jgi:hypothetical protein
MSERRTRTPERIPDDVTDGATITGLCIELYDSSGLLRYEPVIAASEPDFSEPTATYPVGLRDDLCGLCSCRRAPSAS